MLFDYNWHIIYILLHNIHPCFSYFVQSEMKLFGVSDPVALKQHFGKKIVELEDEKKVVQVNLPLLNFMIIFLESWENWYSLFSIKQEERDRLLAEVENLAANTDGQTQKLQDIHSQKLKTLEAQVTIFLLPECYFLQKSTIFQESVLKDLLQFNCPRFWILRRSKRIRCSF